MIKTRLPKGGIWLRADSDIEAAYREAWHAWLLAPTHRIRKEMEHLMDQLQPGIADTPADPRWQDFKASLPGFQDFWDRRLDRDREAINKAFGHKGN